MSSRRRTPPVASLTSSRRDVIPRTFHRVWVGGEMPSEFVGTGDTWLAHNPGWTLHTWTDDDLPALQNQALFDAAPSLVESRLIGRFRSNLARLELLYRFGGVYLDTDFVALAPIPDRYQQAECFVGRESPQFVNNGIIGAAPGHPWLKKVIDAIPESVRSQPGKPSNVTCGPHLFTRLLDDTVTVIPTAEVYPYPWQHARDRRRVSLRGAWAHHLWAGSRPQVSVLVPWQAGCPIRERNMEWVVARLRREHPDWQVVVSEQSGEGWSRARALVENLPRTFGKIIVVHDADCWVPSLSDAVEETWEQQRWTVPHWNVHRLTEDATVRVLGGAEPNPAMPTVERPYRGVRTGGVVVMPRELFEQHPPDVRFVGWGGEDEAWGHRLMTLAGQPLRSREPLYHLWHPPAERLTRRMGSVENETLAAQYRRATGNRKLMEKVVNGIPE